MPTTPATTAGTPLKVAAPSLPPLSSSPSFESEFLSSPFFSESLPSPPAAPEELLEGWLLEPDDDLLPPDDEDEGDPDDFEELLDDDDIDFEEEDRENPSDVVYVSYTEPVTKDDYQPDEPWNDTTVDDMIAKEEAEEAESGDDADTGNGNGSTRL